MDPVHLTGVNRAVSSAIPHLLDTMVRETTVNHTEALQTNIPVSLGLIVLQHQRTQHHIQGISRDLTGGIDPCSLRALHTSRIFRGAEEVGVRLIINITGGVDNSRGLILDRSMLYLHLPDVTIGAERLSERLQKLFCVENHVVFFLALYLFVKVFFLFY